MVYERSGRFALRCLVWHPCVHALVVGLQNRDVVRVNVQTAPRLIRNKVRHFYLHFTLIQARSAQYRSSRQP